MEMYGVTLNSLHQEVSALKLGRKRKEAVLSKMSMRKHVQFIARTVIVNQNNVEEACRTINRIMGAEGWFDQFRRTRRYEKPFQTRRRVNYEKCKAIYNEDMARKIQFVMRTNRLDPFPGCS